MELTDLRNDLIKKEEEKRLLDANIWYWQNEAGKNSNYKSKFDDV